jgi:hypothetical protein
MQVIMVVMAAAATLFIAAAAYRCARAARQSLCPPAQDPEERLWGGL